MMSLSGGRIYEQEARRITKNPILELYPNLETTDAMFNLLNKHPEMLEKGIPLSMLNDLTNPILSLTETMMMILEAVQLKHKEVLTKEPVRISELRELGYVVKEASESGVTSISGWIVPETFP